MLEVLMKRGTWVVALEEIDDGEQVCVEPGECGEVLSLGRGLLVRFDLRPQPYLCSPSSVARMEPALETEAEKEAATP